MAARGLLVNPALFLGYSTTPPECVWDWITLCTQHASMNHEISKRLLTFMTYNILSKPGRYIFYNFFFWWLLTRICREKRIVVLKYNPKLNRFFLFTDGYRGILLPIIQNNNVNNVLLGNNASKYCESFMDAQ
jgi:hypothetical protein